MSTQSPSTMDQYLQLLDLTYEVAQSLKGKPSPDSRWPDCQQLAAKLFFHAATVYWLREASTKAPVPRSLNGCSFYDFPSVAVLTRAALETYLTMFEVFFEPATEDEFEFKHTLWQLSGFVIRENYVSSDPALQSQFANAQKEIQDMRTRLQNTKKYKSLKPSEQRRVSKGKAIRSWKAVAKAAEFGEQTIQRMYAYYSGYVHADGLSGTQIVTAKTPQDQIEHIEAHMRTIMIVLSKMILDYAKKFPEAKAVCDKNPTAYYRAEIWSGAASRLP
jgi:hypothetical protein